MMENMLDFEDYRDVSGIYYILESKSGRIYVGSSVDMRRRVRQHYTDLVSNIHKNEYLQRTWNKRKSEDFSVGVIETVAKKENLLNREQAWMNFFHSFDRDKGFNLTPTAGSNLGFKKTKEQIENNKIALRGKRNTNLSEEEASRVKTMINSGKSLKEISEVMGAKYETIRSIRRGHSFKYIDPQIEYDSNMKEKLTEKDVIEIKKMLNNGSRVKDLSIAYNVSHRTISAIKNEINWKNVGERIKTSVK